MCNFFSVISDGKGHVEFFKPEDVVSIMASGNPEGYSFNSHTSFCHFFFKGNKAKQEDQWNKWEYNPEKDELEQDTLVADNDSKKVKKFLKDWFKGKDILYLRNLYGSNTGDYNTGYYNIGNYNTGDYNTGDYNTGYYNIGNYNTGHYNTGYYNIGNYNTGYYNTANYCSGFFCTTSDTPRLFNKPCSEETAKKLRQLSFYFPLTEWISGSDMTKAEKETHEFWKTTDGYLKKNSYQEAWEMVAKKEPKIIKEIQSLENFDPKIFKEITGLDVK